MPKIKFLIDKISKKRLISVVLALTIAFSTNFSVVNAAVTSDATDASASLAGFQCQAMSDGITITKFTPPSDFDGHLVIPATIGGISVTSIDLGAFRSCDMITDVTIPSSVISIGEEAFNACSGLKTVTIPNGVISIGINAFSNCTELTAISIPSSVTSIEVPDFINCTKLTNITVDAANVNYSSSDGVLYSHDGKTLLLCPNGKSATFNIPSSVTSIGKGAFGYCSGLTSITIPSSVTAIDTGAFDGCSGLTAITLPNSVTSIGDEAFGGCSGLTAITLPSNITSIGDITFGGCSKLKTITIPDSVTAIGFHAFEDCSGLTAIAIPGNVTSICDNAFDGCSGLTAITIPSNVISIGKNTFDRCKNLSSVTFNGKVATIDDSAFDSLVSKTITFTVPTGAKAYYEGLLTSAVMGSSSAKVVEAAPVTPTSSTSSTTPVTIKDSASGATVVGLGGFNLGPDTALTVAPVSDTQAINKAAHFLLVSGNTNADLKGATLEAVYQITLNQKGVSIEPNGKVSVTLPLSAQLKGHKNLQIVRIGDDGTITPMSTVCDGTNITFETDHFSTYGIVEIPQAAAKSTSQQATSNHPTGDNSPIQLLAVLTLAAAGTLALAAVRKKRYNH